MRQKRTNSRQASIGSYNVEQRCIQPFQDQAPVLLTSSRAPTPTQICASIFHASALAQRLNTKSRFVVQTRHVFFRLFFMHPGKSSLHGQFRMYQSNVARSLVARPGTPKLNLAQLASGGIVPLSQRGNELGNRSDWDSIGSHETRGFNFSLTS